MRTRPPRHPALQRLVTLLWVGTSVRPRASREAVIPTGQVHLAWRACGTPLRLGETGAQCERHGVVGGPRIRAHQHDTPMNVRSVGAMLAPGALPRFFGMPAKELTGLHVGLDTLWGAEAIELQERLGSLDEEQVLEAVESALVQHLRAAPRPPGLGLALAHLDRGASVGDVAATLGRSTRALGHWFDEAVGLSPAQWRGLRRLQHALDLAESEADWSVVALQAGYADQAHLSRSIRAITGVTPTRWRSRSHADRNHIPAAD